MSWTAINRKIAPSERTGETSWTRPGEEPIANAQAKSEAQPEGAGAIAGVHAPLTGDIPPDVRQQLAELRGTVPDDQLAVRLVVQRKEAKPAAARVDNTDSPLHNPVRTDAPPASRASARGSAVMPRPSTGSESGGVEMREVEPTLDLASAYGHRPSTVDGRNDMHVREALSLGNDAAAAAAKDD